MLSIQNSLTGEGAPKILAPGKTKMITFVLCKTQVSRCNCFISLFALGRLFIKEGPLLKVSMVILNTIEKWRQSVEKYGYRPTEAAREIRFLNTGRRVIWKGAAIFPKLNAELNTYYTLNILDKKKLFHNYSLEVKIRSVTPAWILKLADTVEFTNRIF